MEQAEEVEDALFSFLEHGTFTFPTKWINNLSCLVLDPHDRQVTTGRTLFSPKAAGKQRLT